MTITPCLPCSCTKACPSEISTTGSFFSLSTVYRLVSNCNWLPRV
eukprot:UN06273